VGWNWNVFSGKLGALQSGGRKSGVPSRRSSQKTGQDKARREPSPPCLLLWCVLIFTGVTKVRDASGSVQFLNFKIRREGFPFYNHFDGVTVN
jgi:hypothetical protein